MRVSESFVLWNHASLKILDVRYLALFREEASRAWQLPASSFLFATKGRAEIWLDGQKHPAQRFYMLHGGKGARLQICPLEDVFEYYVIYYKALLPLPMNQELIAMLERQRPFDAAYGFLPEKAVCLLQNIQLMHEEWEKRNGLEHFHVRALFYQVVYELLRQMHNPSLSRKPNDLAAQALGYIQENYAQPLSLGVLAELLDSSPRHLSRLFKQRTGSSPIEYMISLRMEKAKELLRRTEASLQDIAEEIGYPDRYYFAKMFKRYTGASPIRYRTEQARRDETSKMARYDIEAGRSRVYSDNGYHHRHDKGGTFIPMRYSNKSSLATILFLCLTLILGACSAPTTTSTANPGAEQPQVNSAASASTSNQPSAKPATKVVSTAKGDVEIPVNPQRVVVFYLLGDVLALNVKPVGISDVQKGAAFEKELEGVQTLGTWFEPNPEAVLALDPDLIIAPSEKIYQMMERVAPTVYIPFDRMTVEERLQKLGEVLGKEGESKKLLSDFHAKVAESKKKLGEAGILDKTVSIMEGGKGNMSVVSSKDYGRGSQIVYEYLGMKAPSIVQAKLDKPSGEATAESVSFEVLPQYAGDFVFRSAYEGMVDLSDNKVWNSIPAIKEGRLIEIDFGLSYYNDIYSLDKQLDFIVDSLLKAAKK